MNQILSNSSAKPFSDIGTLNLSQYSDLRALSIRQPWCHHILNSGKDIENRTWRTNFRGPVLIHASKKAEDPAYCRQVNAPLGGIVGVMEIVDCVDHSDSKWFQDPYGFVIRNAKPLQFIPCKGRLGFFKPDLSAALETSQGALI